MLLVAETIWAGRPAVLGAVAIDPTALFLQGTVLLVAMLAVIFMAERTGAAIGAVKAASAKVAVTVGGGLDSFTPQASAVPGSDARPSSRRRAIATES